MKKPKVMIRMIQLDLGRWKSYLAAYTEDECEQKQKMIAKIKQAEALLESLQAYDKG